MNKLNGTITAILLLTVVGCSNSQTPGSQETKSPSVRNNTLNGEISSSSPNLDTSPSAIASSPLVKLDLSSSDSVPSPIATPSTKVAQSKNSTTPIKTTAPGANQPISSNGIGDAKVGMKLGELKELLKGRAEFQVKSQFIADFDAIAIVQGAKEQYYILYPAGTPMQDSEMIEALITDNPNYQTAEGVSPGTTLKKAAAIYGNPTLSYNLANESREYVKFAKQPSKRMDFRIGSGNDGSLAGIYPSPPKELNQTKEFKDTAIIRFIEVYCGSNCPVQTLP